MMLIRNWVIKVFIFLTVIFSVIIINTAYAASVTVKVTVTAAPSCTINNNKTIEVNFQEVVTTRIDGGDEYLRPVNYTLECKDATNKTMKMMVEGITSSFNEYALKTNFDDLGIELHVNGHKQEISKWFKFNYEDKPELEVVPVKRTGSKLSTGAFSAGATLKVEYP